MGVVSRFLVAEITRNETLAAQEFADELGG
jgi:hypothetical protein